MTKKAEPRLKAVTEPAKGKAITEMEKAAANARQVLGDVLDFRQRQLVEQCIMLAEKVQQLHLSSNGCFPVGSGSPSVRAGYSRFRPKAAIGEYRELA